MLASAAAGRRLKKPIVGVGDDDDDDDDDDDVVVVVVDMDEYCGERVTSRPDTPTDKRVSSSLTDGWTD